MGVFHVDIVSAEESIYSGPAEFLVAPAEAGEVGVYPQHTPMLTRIKPGSVVRSRNVTVEVNTVFQSLQGVVQSIDPAKLSRIDTMLCAASE